MSSQRTGESAGNMLADFRSGAGLEEIRSLILSFIESGSDRLPLPAGGDTGERWRMLAEIGSLDLGLAKIFESHADATAILAELGVENCEGKLRAVWAAEIPSRPLQFDRGRLDGSKPWCSGATITDEGLLTAKSKDGQSVLVRVDMDQSGVSIRNSSWASDGMSSVETTEIDFHEARAEQIGGSNAYLDRPGFWQGGAGVAAVWYGATFSIARTLIRSVQRNPNPHAEAHLGMISARLRAARATLHETAKWIDENPTSDAFIPAMTVRTVVEDAAQEVIRRCGNALGAVPFAVDDDHARRVADLGVFLKQSHAERDWAALGSAVAAKKAMLLW